jgi:hypothetical protein
MLGGILNLPARRAADASCDVPTFSAKRGVQVERHESDRDLAESRERDEVED